MTLPKPTFRDFIWLSAIITLPLFASSQPLKNDTVKIKALVASGMIPGKSFPLTEQEKQRGIEGVPIIVRGYAVYKVEWDMDDIDPGGEYYIENGKIIQGRPQRKIYTFLNLVSANKRDTLKNVYDYKELDW